VTVSMDGKGQCLDNIFVERLWRSVKYEYSYPCGPARVLELERGQREYFGFYNDRRVYQSLDHRPMAQVAVALQRGRSIRDRRQPRDRVVDARRIIVNELPAVGIGHTRQPRVIARPAAIERVRILHLWRRASPCNNRSTMDLDTSLSA
jgi:hypothetical protein